MICLKPPREKAHNERELLIQEKSSFKSMLFPIFAFPLWESSGTYKPKPLTMLARSDQ